MIAMMSKPQTCVLNVAGHVCAFRPRCNRPGTVWHRKDGHVCCGHPAANRYLAEAVPGTCPRSHTRAGSAGKPGCFDRYLTGVKSEFNFHVFNASLTDYIDKLVFEQIQKVVIALGDYMSAQCHACIGGTNVREDLHKLSTGVHVVVGTPGRVFDMINRRALSTLQHNVVYRSILSM